MRLILLCLALYFGSTAIGQSRFFEGELIANGINIKATADIGKIEFFSFEYNWLRYGKDVYSAQSNSVSIKDRRIGRKYSWVDVENFELSKLVIEPNFIRERVEITDPLLRTRLFNVLSCEVETDKAKEARAALCYEPRNAIVLYDKNDTIYAIIELCFECGNHVLIQQDFMKANEIRFCYGAASALKDLLYQAGIRHGVEY